MSTWKVDHEFRWHHLRFGFPYVLLHIHISKIWTPPTIYGWATRHHTQPAFSHTYLLITFNLSSLRDSRFLNSTATFTCIPKPNSARLSSQVQRLFKPLQAFQPFEPLRHNNIFHRLRISPQDGLCYSINLRPVPRHPWFKGSQRWFSCRCEGL